MKFVPSRSTTRSPVFSSYSMIVAPAFRSCGSGSSACTIFSSFVRALALDAISGLINMTTAAAPMNAFMRTSNDPKLRGVDQRVTVLLRARHGDHAGRHEPAFRHAVRREVLVDHVGAGAARRGELRRREVRRQIADRDD